MTLKEIIVSFEGAVKLFPPNSGDPGKYQMEVILVLAQELQKLKDHIVKAVNAHEALVEACEEMLSHFVYGGVYKEEVYADMITRTRAALRLAGEEL